MFAWFCEDLVMLDAFPIRPISRYKAIERVAFLFIISIGFFGWGSAYAATVTVDTTQTRQRIEGLGANLRQLLNDPSAVANVNELTPPIVRVPIPHTDMNDTVSPHPWEVTNDNDDPLTFNFSSAFNDQDNTKGATQYDSNRDLFLMMQDLKKRGVRIVASLWNVPDWMVQDPTLTSNRHIPPSMYAEAIEYIAAFLVVARDTYGITIEYVSFNEPNIGISVRFTSQEMANFIKQAGPRFVALGLSTKFLLGDAVGPNNAVSYITPILQDAQTLPYLGPLSFHDYHQWVTDAVRAEIWNVAALYNKKVWVAEIGPDHSSADPDLTTWSTAMDVARKYYRDLKHARASAVLYWGYGRYGNFELRDRATLTPYPTYYVIRQYVNDLPVGTDIVEATSDDSAVLVLAGKHTSANRLVVELLNTATSQKTVTISGLPNGTLTLFRTSQSENLKTIGNLSAGGGQLTMTLPGESLSSLRGVLTSNTAPDNTPPAAPSGLLVR